jgi:hypothetical protein
MLRMANKRQVGVEDKRQITDGHGRTKTKVLPVMDSGNFNIGLKARKVSAGPPDGDCSKNVNCILGASPTLQSYRLPGFNASIASGGTVTCSEWWPPLPGEIFRGKPSCVSNVLATINT